MKSFSMNKRNIIWTFAILFIITVFISTAYAEVGVSTPVQTIDELISDNIYTYWDDVNKILCEVLIWNDTASISCVYKGA